VSITIPASYRDLVNGPRVAALTTVMPDGQPQSSLVWCDYDGECARLNTTRERQKGRNMQANPPSPTAFARMPIYAVALLKILLRSMTAHTSYATVVQSHREGKELAVG
jgi:hypothetical protein